MLEQYPEFVVEGEAKNADEAKAQIEQVRPEVVFLDIQMPGPSGFSASLFLIFSIDTAKRSSRKGFTR